MTTDNIQELSEKLSELYDVPAGVWSSISTYVNLAEDSGRISDLADENGVSVEFRNSEYVIAYKFGWVGAVFTEEYKNHPNKATAARMARVKCLIAIKGE